MWSPPDMLRQASADRADALTDVALLLVADEGLAGLSASAIGRRMGVTPQALFNRYGSTKRILRIVLVTAAARWDGWMASRVRSAEVRDRTSPVAGLLALLPSTPDDIEQTRWWLALRAFADHARAGGRQDQDGRSSELVARADDTDRLVASRFLAAGAVDAVADDGGAGVEAGVEYLLACVNGLRHRLVSGADPLAPDLAAGADRRDHLAEGAADGRLPRVSTPTSPGSPGVAPAGWYADPAATPSTPTLRWWDGERWTEHTAPGAVPGSMPDGRTATPDGVPLAGWWQRVGALLIDNVIVLVVGLALGFPFLHAIAHDFSVYFGQAMDAARTGTQPPDQLGLNQRIRPAVIGLSAVFLVVLIAYQSIMLKTKAATVGKLAVGLRVRLRDSPGPLGWSTIARRLLAQFVIVFVVGLIPLVGGIGSLYSLLDVLWPLWDDKRQALHDKFARTNVVQGSRRSSSER